MMTGNEDARHGLALYRALKKELVSRWMFLGHKRIWEKEHLLGAILLSLLEGSFG